MFSLDKRKGKIPYLSKYNYVDKNTMTNITSESYFCKYKKIDNVRYKKINIIVDC